MEFERPFRRKKEVTEAEILQACQNLANILAKGKWSMLENRMVTIDRSYTQVLGLDINASKGFRAHLKENAVTTRVSFIGEKDVSRYDKKVYSEEAYTVNATITEVLGFEDLPEFIMEKFLKEIDSDHTLGTRIQRAGSIDEAMSFKREQKITYFIDECGDIIDYSITFRYLRDNEVLNEAKYETNDDEANSRLKMATAYMDREPLEWQSIGGDVISKDDVTAFMESFDEVIDEIETEGKFEDILSEESYFDNNEHNRRVLAIIALNASGFANSIAPSK